MDMKSLSSPQVWWEEKLSWYYFQINYYQEKAKKIADKLSRLPQRNQAKQNKLQTEITQIYHKLQFLLTNVNFSGLSISAKLSPLYQVFICRTYVLL